ncbi:MAG TPA: hypothetical protein VLY20_09900 [Nitrospiria bacterium]|nr:hypothetical protein [Nitrospiria bacterium]
MKRLAVIYILFGAFLWIYGSPAAWAQNVGSVVITNPTDGATVHGPIIELDLTVDKGARGDAVHLYVDGRFEAIVKGNRYRLKNLPPGPHRIDAKLATRRHEEIGPSASVTFTVE